MKRIAAVMLLALVATSAVGQQPNSGNLPGRYQIVLASPGEYDRMFLLDTATGQVWRYMNFQNGQPAWIIMCKVDNNEDLRKMGELLKDGPPKTPIPK